MPIVSNSPTPSPFDGYSETYYECIVPDYPNFFGGDGGYYGSPGDGGYTRNCDPEELGLLAEMDDAGLPIELAVKMNATEATANIFFEVIFVDPPPAPGAAAVNLSLAKGEEQLQQVRKIANTTPKPRVKIKNNLDVPIQIDGGVTLRRAGETSGEIELSTLTKVALFKEVNVFGTITKIPLGTVLRHTINVKGVP